MDQPASDAYSIATMPPTNQPTDKKRQQGKATFFRYAPLCECFLFGKRKKNEQKAMVVVAMMEEIVVALATFHGREYCVFG